MPRGITEKDVFTACDALVLAGERPTIERVRQKIGRGSPNTVSPMLDAWFKGLGRRLQDPGAFEPPSDVPEPVLQAAQHFWEVAEATARAELDTKVTERLAPMQAEVERAVHAEAVALAERDVARSRMQETTQQLTQVMGRLDETKVVHAATLARVDAAQLQIADLAARLEAAETALREADERARAEIETAHGRASGAERRAALQIEDERMARGMAEKRAQALEKRVEGLQATIATHLEELVRTHSQLDGERAASERLRAANDAANAQCRTLDDALVEAKVAIGRAEAEARTTQAAMAQLLPLLAGNNQKKATPKARQAAKGA